MTKVNFKCPHCGEVTQLPTNVNVGCSGIGCGTIIAIILAFFFASEIEGCVTHIVKVWRTPTAEVAE